MAAPMQAGMPDSLDLGGGYSVEFTALDASGNDVTAVKVSLACLTVENVSATLAAPQLQVGPWQLIPFDDLNAPEPVAP